MFGNDENQDQSQHNNNAPVNSAPLTDSTDSAPSGDSDQSTPDATNLVNTPAPTTITPLSPATPSVTPATDDLLDIKHQALQHLSPLVSQLDQSPEEKFRTTMMMIQASDDQSLVKEAFESAKQISDDKTRAQALLDVINEINYFTQQK